MRAWQAASLDSLLEKAGHGQAKARLKRVKPVDSYRFLVETPFHAKLTFKSENEVVPAPIRGGAVTGTPG